MGSGMEMWLAHKMGSGMDMWMDSSKAVVMAD